MNDFHEKYVVLDKGKRYFVGNFSAWWELQPDNYNTRMICGSKCLYSPKFQITPQLFEYTLQRLSLFSHVLFLEDMEASYMKFERAVGWKSASNITHKHKNKRYSGNKTIIERLSESNVTYDPFTTALDDTLYAFARKRFEGGYTDGNGTASLVNEFIDSEGARDYFRDGSSRNCEYPCCGECSRW